MDWLTTERCYKEFETECSKKLPLYVYIVYQLLAKKLNSILQWIHATISPELISLQM